MSSPHTAPARRCFGQRMLSPYRGVMHCVVTDWADAVTTDGRHWTLYVRGECLYDDLDELADQVVTVPDVKYGTWSERDGFQRAPIRLPTFDERVCHEGEILLGAVLDNAAALPFALADRYELWLLHGRTGRPLALIGSACSHGECEAPTVLRWTPGQRCMEELPEARTLAGTIAGLAGDTPAAHWYERRPDGSGRACDATGEILDAAHFAPLQVDPRALDDEQGAWLEAVQRWQAPSLLQLPTLSREQRETFEAAACRHALRLAEQLPLYPCVRDRAAITAALVEARLRRSSVTPSVTEAGRAMSPDYLETPGD